MLVYPLPLYFPVYSYFSFNVHLQFLQEYHAQSNYVIGIFLSYCKPEVQALCCHHNFRLANWIHNTCQVP